MAQPLEQAVSQLLEIGEVFQRIANDPDVVGELLENIGAPDPDRWDETVAKAGVGPLNAVTCITLVETFMVLKKGKPRLVEVCHWLKGSGSDGSAVIDSSQREDAQIAVASAETSRRMIEALKRLGLLKCTVTLEFDDDVIAGSISKTLCFGQ
jgi:hypothetical protein